MSAGSSTGRSGRSVYHCVRWRLGPSQRYLRSTPQTSSKMGQLGCNADSGSERTRTAGLTLVVALGEFGRTPKLSTLAGQTTAGRDHWANAMSVLMAGGGTPGGTVVGATDRKGFSAVDRVLSPENFVSTIYHKLGINGQGCLYTTGPTGSSGQRSHADRGVDLMWSSTAGWNKRSSVPDQLLHGAPGLRSACFSLLLRVIVQCRTIVPIVHEHLRSILLPHRVYQWMQLLHYCSSGFRCETCSAKAREPRD